MLATREFHVRDIFLNLSHFLDHFMMLIFAKAAFDASKFFKINYEQFIIFGTLGFVMFGAMAPLAAYLADKYSRANLMILYHFGLGLSSISAGFSNSVENLTLSLGLMGVFASIYHPVGISMLLKSNKQIGFRLGINGVFGNMGVAAAPLITGALLFVGNWKICFIYPGILCVLYGIIFLKALKKIEKINISTKPNFKEKKFAPNSTLVLSLLTLTTISGGFIFGSLTFFIPRYFEISLENISSSVFLTGLLASIVYAISSFSQVGVGWLIDRFSPKWTLFFVGIGQFIFIYLSSFTSDFILVGTMLIAMCFVFGQIPITDTIISRYVTDKLRAKILSFKFLLNLSVGALVLPVSSAMLQLGLTVSDLFLFLSVVALNIIIASIFLPNQDNSERVDKN